ncbi:universal stress protein [Methanobacterium sp. MBAC-LM]|uniref:universal stress protein n=1 Tax=Methanobacterium sp. MBAC-LM TaxID=3412034 RepID=UPI003C74040C
MYKKILLPIDGSECAERAGGHAIWTSNVSGADIVVLYVVDTYFLRSAYLPNFRGELYDSLQNEGEEVVEHFRKKLEESQCEGLCKGVKLKTEVTGGKPYEEILDTIRRESIDVVFMGSTGKHGCQKSSTFEGLNRTLFGSTTDRVLRSAKVPVVVVP